jgi:hypothetical protein
MLSTDKSRDSGFLSFPPAPSMVTPIKWFGSLVGSGIGYNAIELNKYISLSVFLWGMWGDIDISLMQRGFTTPHVRFYIGEIPHKKWGGEKSENQANKTVPHKKRGELPATAKDESLVSCGFSAYLPNSPRFTDTYAYIFLVTVGV